MLSSLNSLWVKSCFLWSKLFLCISLFPWPSISGLETVFRPMYKVDIFFLGLGSHSLSISISHKSPFIIIYPILTGLLPEILNLDLYFPIYLFSFVILFSLPTCLTPWLFFKFHDGWALFGFVYCSVLGAWCLGDT